MSSENAVINCNCTGLSKRISNLRSDTELYKTQVNITGGIFIGVIVILTAAVIYFYICLRKMQRQFEQKLNEIDPLRGRVIVSGEPRSIKAAEPIYNRFKKTSGNFDGLSPTDFTHFDFPSKNGPGGINHSDDYSLREPKSPHYGRW